MTQFFVLLAIEIGGLFAIWFILKARIGRYLELENLLSGVREEARALILELNETADRNVSLVEDRMTALRELLGEVDRRIGVQKREIETRDAEREVYARLNKRRPIVPDVLPEGLPGGQSFNSESRDRVDREGQSSAAVAISSPSSQSPVSRQSASVPAQPAGAQSQAAPASSVPERPGSQAEPITLSFGPVEAQVGRPLPEVRLSEEPLNVARSRREEALDLHRRGISADLIAARLGATVAEIELLVEIEERRQANSGGSS